MKRLKQLKEDREVEKDDSDEVCSETDDEAEKDDEAQVMDLDDEVPAWEPLLNNMQSTRISDPEKKSDSRAGVARRAQAPKRSRVVVSDEESEESAGAISPNPPKRKFTRSSVKSTSVAEAHPPSSGRKIKKPEAQTLHLSSDDDDEPLATAIQARNAPARKKTSPLEHENVNPPNNSKAMNSLARHSRVVEHVDFNDESLPEDLEERRGMEGVMGMGKPIASGQTPRGSRGEARKATSSHHDGAASHNSDTHARSSVMQVTFLSLCIVLYDQVNLSFLG